MTQQSTGKSWVNATWGFVFSSHLMLSALPCSPQALNSARGLDFQCPLCLKASCTVDSVDSILGLLFDAPRSSGLFTSSVSTGKQTLPALKCCPGLHTGL